MTAMMRLVEALRALTEDGKKPTTWDAIHAAIKAAQETTQTVEIGSLLSKRTKEGLIELSVNGESTQMDVRKAIEVTGMLHAAIEAAITDKLLYDFFTTKIQLDPEQINAVLLDFREMRQGTRETVWPM